MNSIQYGPNYPICPNRDAKQTHIDEKRELRDRVFDPRSPYLFLLVVEALSRGLHRLFSSGVRFLCRPLQSLIWLLD